MSVNPSNKPVPEEGRAMGVTGEVRVNSVVFAQGGASQTENWK